MTKDFVARYRALPNDALIQLASEISGLVPDAQKALQTVIAERGLITAVAETRAAARAEEGVKEDIWAAGAFCLLALPLFFLAAAVLLALAPSRPEWPGVLLLCIVAALYVWFVVNTLRRRILIGRAKRPGKGLELNLLLFLLIVRPIIALLQAVGALQSAPVVGVPVDVQLFSSIAVGTTICAAIMQWLAAYLVSDSSASALQRKDLKTIVALLWLSEPLPTAALAIFAMGLLPNPGEAAGQLLIFAAISAVVVGLWTMYLLRSKRVAARYSGVTFPNMPR